MTEITTRGNLFYIHTPLLRQIREKSPPLKSGRMGRVRRTVRPHRPAPPKRRCAVFCSCDVQVRCSAPTPPQAEWYGAEQRMSQLYYVLLHYIIFKNINTL
jgi:hypothetical protein